MLRLDAGLKMIAKNNLLTLLRDHSPQVLLAEVYIGTGGIRPFVQPQNMQTGEWDEILGKRHALIRT